MKPLFAPAAIAPIMHPSISRCGFFCISRRSLKVPGSDSSALQQRYLSIVALGDEAGLLAHREAGAAAAAQARLLELVEHRLRGHLEQRLAQRAVAAEPLVDRRSCGGRARRCSRAGPRLSPRSDLLARDPPARCPGSSGPRRPPSRAVLSSARRASALVSRRRRGRAARRSAVDRGHRRHVAGAQALELAHLDVLELLVPASRDRVVDAFALRRWQATLVQT